MIGNVITIIMLILATINTVLLIREKDGNAKLKRMAIVFYVLAMVLGAAWLLVFFME